ncbi:MAG: hypothetical protein K0R83_1589 [Caulobacter sp.]|jgi:hypothetical protein|nr:hypothetical protein [Caulobacter sp.]
MDRRAFLVGAATAATLPAVAVAQEDSGTVVTVRGYLKRITNHYYAISPTAQKTDPSTTSYAAWPTEVIRVYPKDAKKMVLGLVTVKGVIYRGRQQDIVSKTVATVVMVDAVMA